METENQNTATSSEVSIDLSKILSGLQQQKVNAQSRLVANRRRIQRALKRLGATKVVVSYSGCGDSGQIDSVEIFKGDLAIKPVKQIRVLTSMSRLDTHQAGGSTLKKTNQFPCKKHSKLSSMTGSNLSTLVGRTMTELQESAQSTSKVTHFSWNTLGTTLKAKQWSTRYEPHISSF